MCFGYMNTMRWPDKCIEAPDDFVMGSDVLKELVPVKGGVPWWECNWEGSPSVPHLGAIKQKIPNFNMWCHHSFQNCVWLGQSIPTKTKQAIAKERELQLKIKRSLLASSGSAEPPWKRPKKNN